MGFSEASGWDRTCEVGGMPGRGKGCPYRLRFAYGY